MELYFPLILDGATGTQLQANGYTGDICAEQWILEHPEVMQKIQKNYIEAGSNVVYAGTFSANRVKLEENGIFNRVGEYNEKLVAISKAVADGKAYVAGDLAPTGKFMAPLGDVSFEELVDIYTEQAVALEKAGVDLYVVETMMTVPDARAAVLAIRSVSRKPILVSFTCDLNGKTLTGSDVSAVLMIMQGMGVDAFGLNCSVGPDMMAEQLKKLAEFAEIPLAAKPNAGMPETENGKTVYKCGPEEFRRQVAAFADAGVTIFGGCCGTTSEHIRVLKEETTHVQLKKPAPLHPELLPLATEKKIFLLPADVSYEKVLSCTPDLADELADEEESACPLVAIRVETAADLDEFGDAQYAVSKPLCLLCEDEQLLEEALRLYQGRAMYEGGISEDKLKEFSLKYGLVY